MGTLSVFTQATSPDEEKTPFGNILAAVMRGNAMVQGQAQAKTVATEQLDDPAPVVTIKAHPKGGDRPPLVTIKDITADQLNGTQPADVQQAHDTPHTNVEKKIRDLGIGSFRDEALREVGVTPKPTTNTPANLQTYGQDYRFQRDMGEGIFKSAIEAGMMKAGVFNKARAAEDLNTMNAAKNAAYFKQDVAPIVAAKTEMQTADNAGMRLAFEAMKESRAEAKFDDSQTDSAVKNIDYGNVSFARWRKMTEDERGRPLSDKEWAKTQQKGLRDAYSHIDDYMKRPTFGAEESAGAALAAAVPADVPISNEKRTQFEQNYTIAHGQWNYKTSKEKLDLQLKAQENEIKAAAVYAQQNANKIMAAAQRGTGEKALEGLPVGTQNLIRGIASGRDDITKVTTARGGNRQAVAELVTAFDPTWSTAVAPARAATYKDFTSGQSFRNIVALNTAVHHLDSATESVAALKNAGPQIWNRIKNYGLEQAGDPRVVKVLADFDALGGELAKTFAGKAGTDQEIKQARDVLHTARSEAQLNAALNEYVRLMGGRASSLTDAYTASMGQAPPPDLIYSQESQRILQKHGFTPNLGGSQGAPDASVPTIEVETAPDGSLRVKKKPRKK